MAIPRMPTQPLFNVSEDQATSISASALKAKVAEQSDVDAPAARFNRNGLSIRTLDNTSVALKSIDDNLSDIAHLLPRAVAFSPSAAMR